MLTIHAPASLPIGYTSSGFVFFLVLVIIYLYRLDQTLRRVPEAGEKLSPCRWTVGDIRVTYERAQTSPVDVRECIPPRQQRRYVVVGGSGLVGGWIVQHLLARGEDPKALRIIDLRRPARFDLTQGTASQVAFCAANVTDQDSVSRAFFEPWPPSTARLPLTVFHAAAVIRAFDRLKDFLHLSTAVNVDGTRHVLAASKAAGADCFVATSSASIAVHRTTFWVPPWKKWPRNYLQILNDEDRAMPANHNEFFGNYAVSKAEAEYLIRAADDPKSGFRTGCIRPANSVFGIGGDNTVGNYLSRGGAPTWLPHIIQNFVYAENVSVAHLLYEQRLIDRSAPDIGGQAFCVTDPNPPIKFSDMYLLLTTLAQTPIHFTYVSPVLMLLVAHSVEWYVVLQHRYLWWILPKPKGDLSELQPALFAISTANLVFSDARARKHPEDGGLGYKAPWTTMEGMCKQVLEWNRRKEHGSDGISGEDRRNVVAEITRLANLAPAPPVVKA